MPAATTKTITPELVLELLAKVKELRGTCPILELNEETVTLIKKVHSDLKAQLIADKGSFRAFLKFIAKVKPEPAHGAGAQPALERHKDTDAKKEKMLNELFPDLYPGYDSYTERGQKLLELVNITGDFNSRVVILKNALLSPYYHRFVELFLPLLKPDTMTDLFLGRWLLVSSVMSQFDGSAEEYSLEKIIPKGTSSTTAVYLKKGHRHIRSHQNAVGLLGEVIGASLTDFPVEAVLRSPLLAGVIGGLGAGSCNLAEVMTLYPGQITVPEDKKEWDKFLWSLGLYPDLGIWQLEDVQLKGLQMLEDTVKNITAYGSSRISLRFMESYYGFRVEYFTPLIISVENLTKTHVNLVHIFFAKAWNKKLVSDRKENDTFEITGGPYKVILENAGRDGEGWFDHEYIHAKLGKGAPQLYATSGCLHILLTGELTDVRFIPSRERILRLFASGISLKFPASGKDLEKCLLNIAPDHRPWVIYPGAHYWPAVTGYGNYDVRLVTDQIYACKKHAGVFFGVGSKRLYKMKRPERKIAIAGKPAPVKVKKAAAKKAPGAPALGTPPSSDEELDVGENYKPKGRKGKKAAAKKGKKPAAPRKPSPSLAAPQRPPLPSEEAPKFLPTGSLFPDLPFVRTGEDPVIMKYRNRPPSTAAEMRELQDAVSRETSTVAKESKKPEKTKMVVGSVLNVVSPDIEKQKEAMKKFMDNSTVKDVNLGGVMFTKMTAKATEMPKVVPSPIMKPQGVPISNLPESDNPCDHLGKDGMQCPGKAAKGWRYCNKCLSQAVTSQMPKHSGAHISKVEEVKGKTVVTMKKDDTSSSSSSSDSEEDAKKDIPESSSSSSSSSSSGSE